MESERNLIYLIEQLERGVRRPFLNVMAHSGLSAPGYTALTVLQRLPGLTSSELARRSFVRAQTMAETINVLQESQFVRREADPDNGRQILLFITPLGIQRIESIAHEITELEEHFLRYLSLEETDVLFGLLRRIRNGLRESDHTGPAMAPMSALVTASADDAPARRAP